MKIFKVNGFKLLLLLIFSNWCKTSFGSPIINKSVYISLLPNAQPREKFGVQKLTTALLKSGFKVSMTTNGETSVHRNTFFIGRLQDDLIKKAMANANFFLDKTPKKEGFAIKSVADGNIIIAGADFSGVLYGCLEMAERINTISKIPTDLSIINQPEMVLRGACIGLQKSTYLLGRGVYEYPYTPETFPWFYNRALWIKYLDSMVENRMNSLYSTATMKPQCVIFLRITWSQLLTFSYYR